MNKCREFDGIAERLNRLAIGPTALEVLGAVQDVQQVKVLHSAVASCEKRERQYWRAAMEWLGVCLTLSRKTEAKLVDASKKLEQHYLEKLLS